LQLQNIKNECSQIFDKQMSQTAKELQSENDRLKRECEEIKITMNNRMNSIEKDYIKISKHEEILNQEL